MASPSSRPNRPSGSPTTACDHIGLSFFLGTTEDVLNDGQQRRTRIRKHPGEQLFGRANGRPPSGDLDAGQLYRVDLVEHLTGGVRWAARARDVSP
jgi:hypothetical protein